MFYFFTKPDPINPEPPVIKTFIYYKINIIILYNEETQKN